MTSPLPVGDFPAHREPAIKVIAMPADANADGDIFGGWLLSQMDLAGALSARQRAQCRVVTVAMDDVAFHLPVNIGDCLVCFTNVIKVGRTSLTVHVEAFVERRITGVKEKVTEGHFIFVAIDENRKPKVIEAA